MPTLACILSLLLSWTDSGQQFYPLQTSYDGTNWCEYITVEGTNVNVVGSLCVGPEEFFSVKDLNGVWHTYSGQIREQLFRVVCTNGIPVTMKIEPDNSL